MKRPDLCFISQMQSLWHNPPSLKWQISLPTFIDHLKCAEPLIRLVKRGLILPMMCMTVNALSNSLLWECRVACCVKGPGDANPHGICSSFL